VACVVVGSADGRVVQVTPAGWSVLGTSPVLFRRTAFTGPLPDPARPGDRLSGDVLLGARARDLFVIRERR
jgi:hypothetical protein